MVNLDLQLAPLLPRHGADALVDSYGIEPNSLRPQPSQFPLRTGHNAKQPMDSEWHEPWPQFSP